MNKGLATEFNMLQLGLLINQDQQHETNSSCENMSVQHGHNNRMNKVSNATRY